MSKIVGYARVSTSEQNLDRQLQALSRYVEPDMIVTDKSSGRDLDRPGYQSLKVGIGKLVEGDTLYIKSLDRLSRNKEDLKKELQYFKDRGVKVKILDMPTTMTDFPAEQAWIGDMITNIMIEVLSSIAQNERETTRQRQLEGIAIAKQQGLYKGRQPIPYDKALFKKECKKWRNGEQTARATMQKMDMKPNRFYRIVKELGL